MTMLPYPPRDALCAAADTYAASDQSDPRRLTLRPGNWVRLTDAVVAHLKLQVGDVMVTDLRDDGTVVLQSLDDWCDQLDQLEAPVQ